MRPLAAFLCLLLMAGCRETTGMNPLFGIAVEGDPSATRLQAFTAETGLPIRVVVMFDAWPTDGKTFESPVGAIKEVVSAGAIPVLTWEPFVFPEGGGGPRVIAAEEILTGKWDTYIDSYLADAASAGAEVWIRFAHEMNSDHYHWGVPDKADFGPEAPFLYRRMFRYVVDRSRQLGLRNLKWVFCPNAESVPDPAQGAGWNRASRYYPGDEWVDLLGMDGYNWGTTVNLPNWQSRWMSFEEIFSPLHRELKTITTEKTIAVFETASANQGGDKARWIAEAAATSRQWGLGALIWFDIEKETDWRLLTGITKADVQPLSFRPQPK